MQGETVILVHGLWMNGLDMTVLRNRLDQQGYSTHCFTYPSMRQSPQTNAEALQRYATEMDSAIQHFVCHSLGGLVLRHLYHLYPDRKPGKIVTLGTPHQNSTAAMRLQRYRLGKRILGKSIECGLVGELPPWHGRGVLGSIAGTLRMGLGMLVPGIPRPNDGTVAVEETRLDGMQDHIALPVSHFGMLLSGQVARQTIHFLQRGNFDHHTGK